MSAKDDDNDGAVPNHPTDHLAFSYADTRMSISPAQTSEVRLTSDSKLSDPVDHRWASDISPAAFGEFVKHENLTMEQHYDSLGAEMALPSLICRPSDSDTAKHIEARVQSLTQKICYFSQRWLGTPGSISKTSDLLRLLLIPHIGYPLEWKDSWDERSILDMPFGVKPSCGCSNYKSSALTRHRWNETRARMTQVIISQTHEIMRQVIEELDQEFPVWNAEWYTLKNMFPFSTDVPLSYGNVLVFVSHIIANIEIFWQTRRFLSSPCMPYMPPEICNMIYHEVIRRKGVRQLPQEGFTLQPAHLIRASSGGSASRDCLCYDEAIIALSASKWQYNLRVRHSSGWQGKIENHSQDCERKIPFETMEEAQSREDELYSDPADIMPPCQSCHKKWGN